MTTLYKFFENQALKNRTFSRIKSEESEYLFEDWGSIWGRRVKGATLFNRSSFELMADTNSEVERGHAKHELSYAEMDSIGMFISKVRPTGITVDAVNDRMLKSIALTW